ncbi:MAG: hypothetical protein HY062_12080, partial [Bacteroidetes bacterium]|nr:hypothetical protein [Bacteroidota bacterium]
MFKKAFLVVVIVCMAFACSPSSSEKTGELKKDTVMPEVVINKQLKDSIESARLAEIPTSDSLNALADIMSGI